MFVRKKKIPSGIINVQIIYKRDGKYRVLKTIGSSSNTSRVDELYLQGKIWMSDHIGEQEIFEQASKEADERQVTDFLLSNVENILINGKQLILDRVFKSVGFDKLNNEILKYLVIARLSQPLSKSVTVDYLKSHFDEDVQLHITKENINKLGYNKFLEISDKVKVAINPHKITEDQKWDGLFRNRDNLKEQLPVSADHHGPQYKC